MLLLSARGAVAAATEPVDQPGTYELVVTGLDPAVYLQFSETGGSSFADSSGSGRAGTLGGGGATLGVTALAPNAGATNNAVNLGNAAWIEIPHAAADVALTTSFASPWNGDHSGNRFIADCTISIWFEPNSLPAGDDRHVIVSKSHTATPGDAAGYFETHYAAATPGSAVSGGSFEAYLDANGAVHVEVRSFRGRPARIRTPDGAVSAGTTHHLVVQLAYDGVAAWLDGAKFEDGYANLMHVYGLSADILGVIYRNDYDWMIGRAAWGGQADLIVDEFAIYLSTLTQLDVEALAQQEDVSPLAHPIWGLSEQSVSGGGVAAINSAINARNAAGGGTVLVQSGTYGGGNVTMQSRVRIKTTGSVTIDGGLRMPDPAQTNLGAGTGTLAIGGKVLDVSNSASAEQVVHISGPTTNPSPLRVDRRWNTLGESNDPNFPDGECFTIQSRTGSSITFEGGGAFFEFTAANRGNVFFFAPTTDIAVEGDFTFNTTSPVRIQKTLRARIVGVTTTTTATNGQNWRVLNDSKEIQCRDCEIFQSSSPSTPAGTNDGFQVTQGSCDVVFMNCTAHDGHHCCDITGSPAFGCGSRAEWHNTTWDGLGGPGSANSGSAFGTHGMSAFGIYWNLTSNWGGVAVTGYKHDVRWIVGGTPSAASTNFYINDGAGDCWYRDIRAIRPLHWFRADGGVVGVDRCRFENITRSASPAGGLVHDDLIYGSGGDVCTYSNVDGPSGEWLLV